MPQVYVPRRPQQMGNALATIGTAIGYAKGGPTGASIGAQVGSTVGGTMDTPGPQPVAQNDSPMARRLASMQSDRLTQLRSSISALPELPDDLRQQYQQPLMEAYMKEASKRGRGIA